MASPQAIRPLLVIEAFARHLPSGAARTPLFRAWCTLLLRTLPALASTFDVQVVCVPTEIEDCAPHCRSLLSGLVSETRDSDPQADPRPATRLRTGESAFFIASLGPGDTITPAPGLASGAGLAVLEATVLSGVSGYSPLASPATLASVHRILDVFTDRSSELLVAGELSLDVWQTLEDETACRVRVLGAPRGSARVGPWRAASEAVPTSELAEWIAPLGDATVMDLRLLSATPASPDDVFWAGLGRADRVRDPALAAFLVQAQSRNQAMLLGSEGLLQHEILGMVALAWKRRDVPRPTLAAIADTGASRLVKE